MLRISPRELAALAPGGVGGRLSPTVTEDQAQENGWRNIGVLEGYIGGRRASRSPQATAMPPPPAPTIAKPPPAKSDAPPAATGNRVQNVPLLDEFLETVFPIGFIRRGYKITNGL